jgi:hypothetical protein
MLWFDRLELENVAVIDPEGNKMISAKTILINFKLSQLFEKKNVNIDGVYLDSAHVLLTKVDEIDSLRDLTSMCSLQISTLTRRNAAVAASHQRSTSAKRLSTKVNSLISTRTAIQFRRDLTIIIFLSVSMRAS